MRGRVLVSCGALLLLACAPAPRPEPSDVCDYEVYEGECVLTDVWIDDVDATRSVVEAQYDTPRGSQTVRHQVARSRAPSLRRHLTRHPRLRCQGRIRKSGSCEPTDLVVGLPPLDAED